MIRVGRLWWTFGLCAILSLHSNLASAGADRVGRIVVEDQHLTCKTWFPIWVEGTCRPDPGVIRGLINLVGESRAAELGIKKRFLTQRTYSVPVVTNDAVCSEAKAWMNAYRKAGHPKLYNWDQAMTFDLAPAVIGAVLEKAPTYFDGLNGLEVGDPADWSVGTHLKVQVRPDLVRSIRGLCD